ncbi:hypothetical protein ACN081_03260 [Rothia sp. P13129]|uniref:hypothetical protein n=1 Tax=Rothia sp. P13129 TaxID=3402664 RepID=UPI003AD3B624
MADSAHEDWKKDLEEEFNAKTDFDIISGRDKEKIDKAKKSEYIKEGQIANAEFLGLTAMRKYIKNKAYEYSVSQYEVWKFLEGKVHSRVAYYSDVKYFKVKFRKTLKDYFLLFLHPSDVLKSHEDSRISGLENKEQRQSTITKRIYVITQGLFTLVLASPLIFLCLYSILYILLGLFNQESKKQIWDEMCNVFLGGLPLSVFGVFSLYGCVIFDTKEPLGDLKFYRKWALWIFLRSIQIFIIVEIFLLSVSSGYTINYFYKFEHFRILFLVVLWIYAVVLFVLFIQNWSLGKFNFIEGVGKFLISLFLANIFSSFWEEKNYFLSLVSIPPFLMFCIVFLCCTLSFSYVVHRVGLSSELNNSVLFEQYQQIIIAAEPPRKGKRIITSRTKRRTKPLRWSQKLPKRISENHEKNKEIAELEHNTTHQLNSSSPL